MAVFVHSFRYECVDSLVGVGLEKEVLDFDTNLIDFD